MADELAVISCRIPRVLKRKLFTELTAKDRKFVSWLEEQAETWLKANQSVVFVTDNTPEQVSA